MQRETITLKAVLDYIDSGATIESISFVTSDKNRGTGGEFITATNCRKHLFISSAEKAKLARAQPRSEIFKDPKHYENSTRNLILSNHEIRKLHIRLIRKFNGKNVL